MLNPLRKHSFLIESVEERPGNQGVTDASREVSMRKIREALRLTHAMGMSRRLVGEATGIGKTAVGEYVRRAAVAGLSWPLPDEIDDAELERRLFPPAAAGSSAARTDPDWSHIHTQMKRRGVTLALLWQMKLRRCDALVSRPSRSRLDAYCWFPIRLLPTPPTCRMLPGSGVKLCVGRCGDVARDA